MFAHYKRLVPCFSEDPKHSLNVALANLILIVRRCSRLLEHHKYGGVEEGHWTLDKWGLGRELLWRFRRVFLEGGSLSARLALSKTKDVYYNDCVEGQKLKARSVLFDVAGGYIDDDEFNGEWFLLGTKQLLTQMPGDGVVPSVDF